MTKHGSPAILPTHPSVVVIGAGIGGLAAAMRLTAAGCKVTVLERHIGPGGKIRTFDSMAGPVDAGPTVLTMLTVFTDLFAAAGGDFYDLVDVQPLRTLARHYWRDGPMLDLMADPEESVANIARVFDVRAAEQFRAFSERAKRLFNAFDAPMMQAGQPNQLDLVRQVLMHPGLLRDMAPHQSLGALLAQSFDDPRLAQLFGRYATYVGGMPATAPALLSLIWQAEANGVWRVQGGMHCLAKAMEQMAIRGGAEFHYQSHVTGIYPNVRSVRTENAQFTADAIVFNGDPRALNKGLLGHDVSASVPSKSVEPRSLSANVLAFAATPSGLDLSHHTVLFGDTPKAEFEALSQGKISDDTTLYICAQDRGDADLPSGPERFEIIMNAPPTKEGPTQANAIAGKDTCLKIIHNRLSQFGLTFDPFPAPKSLTTPGGFEHLFPASLGSLYGRSPAGVTAGLKRPTARTKIPGLYLVGGGAHPGAGVPMATLSGKHAAEAIMQDLTLR